MLQRRTKSGSTPLHSAAATNRHSIIPLLLEKGADQAARDDDELTPYDLAKAESFWDVLALLDVQKAPPGSVTADKAKPVEEGAIVTMLKPGCGGCCVVQ